MHLKDQIALADQDLFDRDVEYISPHDPTQSDLFSSTTLGWDGAISICEKSGTAFNESMILNALKSSKLLFVVTLDFDIGYAALDQKSIVLLGRPALLKSPETNEEKADLFLTLLRSREDIFPKRWENNKTGKSGYAPVCDNEWVKPICQKPSRCF